MAKTTHQIILNTFRDVQGGIAPGISAAGLVQSLIPQAVESLPQALAEACKQIDVLKSASQTQTEAVGSNTQAVQSNTVAHSSGAVSQAASAVGQFLGGGLTAVPVIGTILKLLGDGKPEAPAPLVRYSLPASIQVEDHYTETPARSSAAAPPQITVQVQAMDSRSFMDHSQEIAQAVREAMLNMHPLNDLVNDL